ncbi:hypothetical protein [Modestobacter sp. URMC 112]
MTTHLAVCGMGAALAMAGHFPSHPRFWVPHAVGLAAMLLACLPVAAPAGLPVALVTLAVVFGWQLRALPSTQDRWAGGSDTVAMAALIALTSAAVPSGSSTTGGTAHAHAHAAVQAAGIGTGLSLALTVLACWLLVRVCTWPSVADRAEGGHGGDGRRRAGLVRSGGGLMMLAGMATMVA